MTTALTRRTILAGGLAALTAGCTTGTGQQPVGSTAARSVTHGLGTTLVPAAPRRIVAVGDFVDLDALVSIGAMPVAYGFSNAWAKGVAPWQQAAGVPDLDRFEAGGEVSPEKIASYQPDLIVGMQWALTKVYDQLSAVAPTVSVDEATPWREVLTTLGAATWRDQPAAEAIRNTEALLADQRAKLAPARNRVLMVASLFGDVLYGQGDQSPIAVLAGDLGLTFRGTGPEKLTEIPLEKLGEVLSPAQVLLSIATDLPATKVLQANALFRQLGAVRGGHYEPMTIDTASVVAGSFSPICAAWGLPRVTETILRCVAGQGRPLP